MSARALRVALCDDDSSFRLLVRLVLEEQDDIDVVTEVCDGRECVEEVAKAKPDVVLLDLSMPSMSGFDVLRDLAAAAPGTKVIVVSAEPPQAAEPAVRALGAASFVEKAQPGLLDSLPGRVRAAVANAA